VITPQGTGWQELRALALDCIPTGTRVYHTNANPLHSWIKKGAYTVPACDKKSAILEAAPAEIGASLLADAEFLLDHGSEHRATLHQLLFDGAWCSPAWLVVTNYYWAFFSALAIGRLTGKSVWYLDKPALQIFRELSGARIQPPAGAFSFTLSSPSTTSARYLQIFPTGKQLHDAVWRSNGDLIKSIFSVVNQEANGMEYRLWWALNQLNVYLGESWLSKIRNSVNYRPGYGYREVIGKTDIEIGKLRKLLPLNMTSLVEHLELAALEVKSRQIRIESLAQVSRIAFLYATALGVIAVDLHDDIIARQNCDTRWRDLRKRFSRRHSASSEWWPL
jgi:hypothetical protein